MRAISAVAELLVHLGSVKLTTTLVAGARGRESVWLEKLLVALVWLRPSIQHKPQGES